MRNLVHRIMFVASFGLAALAAAPAGADLIADPTGDFLPTFTAGPQSGDLDVTGVEVTTDGVDFVLTATLAGDISATSGVLYVWGVDRGAGTARFPTLAPGVLFDSVVLLRADGTGVVNRIVGGGSTNLDPSAITISGNTITAVVSASLLPTRGLSRFDYTFNLWPRLGAGNNNQISDFAPDNSNIGARFVPEPSSWLMLGTGLTLALVGLRRRVRPLV